AVAARVAVAVARVAAEDPVAQVGVAVALAVVEAPVVPAVVGAAAGAEAAVAVRAVPASVVHARRGSADARTEARQVPQTASGTPGRLLAGPGQGPVRRVRAQGARCRLADQPADRGRPYRDDPQDQARRQGVDQRVSGQA